MSAEGRNNWLEENQRYLVSAIGDVRALLLLHADGKNSQKQGDESRPEMEAGSRTTWNVSDHLPAIETVCRVYDLSAFERNILLMCAAVELDSTFEKLYADAAGDPSRAYPTFSLALATLPEPHWSALSPERPLRRWKLIEVRRSDTLVKSPLRIDESILHFLAGLPFHDESLAGIVEDPEPHAALAPSQKAVADQIILHWTNRNDDTLAQPLHLCGNDFSATCAVVQTAAASLGLGVKILRAGSIPANATDRAALARLLERTALLSRSVLLIDTEMAEDATLSPHLAPFIDAVRALIVVAGIDPLAVSGKPLRRIDVCKPTAGEQTELWKEALTEHAQFIDGKLSHVVSQYNLGASAIRTIGAQFPSIKNTASDESDKSDMFDKLWSACRMITRPRMSGLARRIEATAALDDLVLPDQQKQTLRDIARFVRQRYTVYETWGFAGKSARGLAISALFSGTSGTGKTMAAEVLAKELRLDLYHIDLSQVVSKYIGETEKNIRRLFDAAEDGGAILFFDEADALFGKRSEVKDSHDRYANIEISYLLQRIETYRGLVILATNMKEALDPAFLRRIRFVVAFPFPDTAARADIWRRIFPADTPKEELEFEKLARLNIPGGNIRNLALYSAFLAADEGQPVRMTHLLRAAKVEYAKLERPLTENETRGWK